LKDTAAHIDSLKRLQSQNDPAFFDELKIVLGQAPDTNLTLMQSVPIAAALQRMGGGQLLSNIRGLSTEDLANLIKKNPNGLDQHTYLPAPKTAALTEQIEYARVRW